MDGKLDYIDESYRQLIKEGRIRDAVKFCEKQAKKNTSIEHQCVALRNLAICHLYYTGDGQACREANLSGIRLLERRKDILKYGKSQYLPAQSIKFLYSDFCRRQHIISTTAKEFGEYEEKPSSIRDLTQDEKNAVRFGTEMTSKKDEWKDFKLTEFKVLYHDSAKSDRNIPPAQVASMGMLMLQDRAVLCLKPEDVNFILPIYAESVVSAINTILDECKSNKMVPEESQLAFIINRASDVINKLRNDQRTDTKIVNACLKTLRECKAQLAKICFDPKAKAKLERLKESASYVTLDSLIPDTNGQNVAFTKSDPGTENGKQNDRDLYKNTKTLARVFIGLIALVLLAIVITLLIT